MLLVVETDQQVCFRLRVMVLVVGIDQLNAMMLTVEIEMYLWLTDQQVCFWLRVMAFGG